jgi:hypothetical protein
MSLPEWGVNHDDPYFIQQMYDWLAANNFAYASYWNSTNAFDGELSNGQYPNAGTAYRGLFRPIPAD